MNENYYSLVLPPTFNEELFTRVEAKGDNHLVIFPTQRHFQLHGFQLQMSPIQQFKIVFFGLFFKRFSMYR